MMRKGRSYWRNFVNFALQASPFALIGAWAETWVMPRHKWSFPVFLELSLKGEQ